jgi:hypothetical protein
MGTQIVFRLEGEAVSVVADEDLNLVLQKLELDVGECRRCMSLDVAERLFDDPQRGYLDGLGNPSLPTERADTAADPEAGLQVPSFVLDSDDETASLELNRLQVLNHAAELGFQPVEQVAYGGEPRREHGCAG